MKTKLQTGLLLVPLAIALAGCDRFPDLLFGPHDHRVVLSDKPLLRDRKPTHFSPDEITTELLLTGQGIQLGVLNAPEVNDWC